jgi:hypothetical protein
MIDPVRLLDGDGDDVERTLLRSALDDKGSHAARGRALAVFGAVGSGLVASTSAAQASVATASTSFAGASVTKVTAGALVKWIGTGVVVGTLSAAGIHAVADSGAAPPRAMLAPFSERRAALPPAPSVAPAGDQPVTVEAPKVGAPEPSARPAELRASGTGAAVAVASNAAFPAEGSDRRLRDELLALERARQALRRGDASAALSALGSYESRFPQGALSREATVLSVEARLAAGDQQGARAVAARALEADSTSPHAKRIETLLSTRKKP